MNEQQQKTFFHGIFNLRVGTIVIGEATDNSKEGPATTIITPALLETLPQLQTSVLHLIINNFALTRQSDVQALSNIILSKCGNLEELQLKSIECPIDDCNKEDSDESDGFLDPLFFATSGLHTFGVSTKMRPVYSALVSPSALRALFVERNRFQRLIMLRGLGLTDSHVLAIADGLSSTYGTQSLTLDSNPGITSEGYDALFRLVKGENVVYGPHWSTKFCVDDKALEGKLNLVSEMNAEYGVLMYLPNGTSPSEERRWQWLEKVADLPMPDEKSFGFSFCGTNEEWDAKHLNFIWYTLCQNPDMMKT
jgi:hypothetical protein